MLLPVIDVKKLWAQRRVRIGLITGAAVVGLTGSVTALVALWPEPAPAPPPAIESDDHDKTIDYMASDDFSRLPMQRRVKWLDAQMNKALAMDEDEFVAMIRDMDDETRERIEENIEPVMRERTKRHAREFCSLSSEERDAYIDQRMAEHRQWDRRLDRAFRDRRRGGRDRDRRNDSDGQARRSDDNRRSSGHARGASGADNRSEQERRQERRRRGRERFRAEVTRFMVSESPDQRAMMISYFNAMGRRFVENNVGRILGRKKR